MDPHGDGPRPATIESRLSRGKTKDGSEPSHPVLCRQVSHCVTIREIRWQGAGPGLVNVRSLRVDTAVTFI